MDFSDQFKKVLRKKQIKLKDAAKKLGVSRQHLSSVIHNKADAGNILARDIVQFSNGDIGLDLVLGSKTRIIKNDCED